MTTVAIGIGTTGARGVFFGVTARHTVGHLTRALMEGVLFGLRQALDVIGELGVRPATIRVTGGGSTSEPWRSPQADIYGSGVHRLAVDEGAGYGTALLATWPAGHSQHRRGDRARPAADTARDLHRLPEIGRHR